MTRTSSIFGTVAFCLSLAAPAAAGIVDTPLPVLPATLKQSKLVVTVTGVYTTPFTNSLETVFHCTNVDSKQVEVAVEVFSFDGLQMNDASSLGSSLVLNPGQTRTFATQNTAGYDEDLDLTLLTTLAATQGSARIIATSTKITCAAQVLDEVSNPPTSIVALPVFPKAKQKGD